MNIAVIDDDPADLEETITLLHQHLTTKSDPSNELHYERFTSTEQFMLQFKPGYYDFIILDIYMRRLTGMDAAKTIASLDKNCQIIFVTTSMDHILDGYTVHAAGYVLKTLSENLPRFYQAVDYCMERLQQNRNVLFVMINNCTEAIPLSDIYFIDCSNNHAVMIYLAKNKIRTSCTYQECTHQLCNDIRFTECYHRVTVNMDKIKIMQDDTFLLMNGQTLPISRRKKNEVKLTYLNYLAER